MADAAAAAAERIAELERSNDQLRQNLEVYHAEGTRITRENNALQQTVQNLSAQFEQVKLARADQQQLAYKYANRAPNYAHDGRKSWQVFLSERNDWMHLYRISADQLGEEWHKASIMSSLKGTAREMVTGMEDAIRAMSLADAITALGELYQPRAESELVRQQFRERKQSSKEDIIRYLSVKEALYRRAYPPTEQSKEILIEETIKGIYNQEVKKEMYRYLHDPSKPLRDYTAVRQHAAATVAAERSRMTAGIAASTTWDGLAATSTVHNSDSLFGKTNSEEDMDISAMSDKKCYGCGSLGHLRAACPKAKGSGGSGSGNGGRMKGKGGGKNDKAFKGKCNRCHRPGHMKKDCHAKKTAEGKTLPPLAGGKHTKVSKIKEGDIEDVDSDDSSEE